MFQIYRKINKKNLYLGENYSWRVFLTVFFLLDKRKAFKNLECMSDKSINIFFFTLLTIFFLLFLQWFLNDISFKMFWKICQYSEVWQNLNVVTGLYQSNVIKLCFFFSWKSCLEAFVIIQCVNLSPSRF